ncbi:MAG: O-antigen ligase family protein [Coleofasciculus sp. G1-WW12-02]|uniref:O-antigen ligase family protein n=1 Tax=Coleofasciculus sp. G1-WW12-02 TaxID=3068483 RepID=UPI00330558E6
MKELILSPIFLPIILAIGTVYLAIVFCFTSRNKKLVAFLEKAFVILFFFTLYSPTLYGFNLYLHPNALAHSAKTLPSAAVQLGLYASVLFVLVPRLRFTLKDSLKVGVVIIKKNPSLCLFLLILSLSAFWSITPMDTFKGSLVLLCTTTVTVYIAKQYSLKYFYHLFRWIGAGIALISLVKRGYHGKGWPGILGHPNQLGAAMALVATLWIWHAINNPKQRWLSIGIICVSFLLLQKTNSAGSKVQVVVLLSLIIYLQFIKKLSSEWAFFGVLVFLIVVTIAAILITENLETIVVDVLNKDMTFTGRIPIWQMVWEQGIKSRPWLGYGYEGFWKPDLGVDDPSAKIIIASTGYKADHAHNGFVDLTVALGLVGCGLFLVSFLTTLARAVLYVTQTQDYESVLPILLLTFMVIVNISISRLLETDYIWCYYIVSVVRLSLDTEKFNF